MPVNTNYELKLTGTMQGDSFQNVLHYQCTATAGGGRTVDVGRLVDGFIADVLPKFVAVACGEVEFLSIRVTEVGVVDPIVQRKPISTPGSADGSPFPPGVAVLITKRCNTGGRRNVGKTYVIGCKEDVAVGGIVITADVDLAALAVSLKTNVEHEGNTYAPIIWHRSTSSAEFITIADVRAQTSHQDRRKVPVL